LRLKQKDQYEQQHIPDYQKNYISLVSLPHIHGFLPIPVFSLNGE
jgi:hypothetical protein